MSWAVGFDRDNDRHVGYGVPATCDHPGCGEEIDRGLSYACGGGVMEDVPNCGLFFCGEHLSYVEADDESGERQGWVCERCAKGEPPFDPTSDTAEWINHVLSDESWEQWRAENPARVADMTTTLSPASPAPVTPRAADEHDDRPAVNRATPAAGRSSSGGAQ